MFQINVREIATQPLQVANSDLIVVDVVENGRSVGHFEGNRQEIAFTILDGNIDTATPVDPDMLFEALETDYQRMEAHFGHAL